MGFSPILQDLYNVDPVRITLGAKLKIPCGVFLLTAAEFFRLINAST